jgi:hypothetical protein
VDNVHLVGLDRGQLLDAIGDLLLDIPDLSADLLVTDREDQDHDEQAVEKDQQEHEAPLAVHMQFVL